MIRPASSSARYLTVQPLPVCGRYAFGLGTLSAGNNYVLELATNPPTFEVKPATLTITPAANQSKVYGSPLPTLNYAVGRIEEQ